MTVKADHLHGFAINSQAIAFQNLRHNQLRRGVAFQDWTPEVIFDLDGLLDAFHSFWRRKQF